MRATILVLSALLPLAAGAVEARHQAAPAPVVFRHHRQLFEGHGFDTGWHPGSGPVQVRFVGAVGAEIDAVLPGTVRLGWGLQPALWAEGDPLAGRLSMDLGAEFRGLLRLDLPLPTGQHLRWEGTLPSVFSLDFRFADAQRFTPFLLAGETAPSVTVEDRIRDTELVSVPLTEAFLPIPGVGGFFDVTGSGSLETTLHDGALVFPEGTLARLDTPLGWAAPAEPTFRTSALYRADADTRGTLELQPRVSVKVGPLVWKLAGLPIPVPLPTRHERWDFGEQAVAVDLPRLALVEIDGTSPVPVALEFLETQAAERVAKQVKVTNVGRAPLEGMLVIEGEGFTATSPEAFSLLPGASAMVAVAFVPPRPGRFEGIARFVTNDPAGPVAVALAGTSAPPPPQGTEESPSAAPALPEGTGADPAALAALPEAGCGCGATGASPAPLAGLTLLAMALARRRKRA